MANSIWHGSNNGGKYANQRLIQTGVVTKDISWAATRRDPNREAQRERAWAEMCARLRVRYAR